MSGIASVYALFVNAEEAERIGRAMVEQRLAACVNILGECRSIYRWRGAIEESAEVAAIFKTTRAGAPALIEAIAAAHSYEVPAAVAWEALVAPPAYANWVNDNVEVS